MGTQRRVSYPTPPLPAPLLPQKMPLKQLQSLYASTRGVCPPRLRCGACLACPAQPSPTALLDPVLALALAPLLPC